MAKPIPLELSTSHPREELHHRLEQAPLAHAEAILAGFEVLQDLHERGVLELLRGVMGGGDKILEIVVEATKTPEAIRGIRNLLILTRVVGSINPEVLEKFAEAVPDALIAASKVQEKEPPSLWQALRMASSAHLRRGLAVMDSVLGTLSKDFSPEKR